MRPQFPPTQIPLEMLTNAKFWNFQKTEAKGKRRILYIVLLIVVAIGSFAAGYYLGINQLKAQIKIVSIETQQVQAAVDSLQKTFPDAILTLKKMNNESDMSKAIAFALLGKNQQINPSNLVFLVMSDGSVENGVLRTRFVKRFIFLLNSQSSNSMANATSTISVTSETAFNQD
jgi:cell division protein FtsB